MSFTSAFTIRAGSLNNSNSMIRAQAWVIAISGR
ncbi:MAG: hypothetical protein DMF38_06545 [Verrucomicrobia bacterium]|nr:MAG: hypothetical protein DMF38_06545 [Verrucomicrobiota bacterium]